MKNYILSAFDCKYSNEIAKGINTLIKQTKHTACNYIKLKHLKAIIISRKKLLNPFKI